MVAAHQLEIVYDDEINAVLSVKTAGLGAHLQGREGGRIVNVERHVRKDARGLDEERPFVILDLTQAQALRINARLGRDQALDHLLAGHLQAKDGHPLVELLGCIVGYG